MEDGAVFFMGAGATGVSVFAAEAFVLFLAGLDAVLPDVASGGPAVSVAGSVSFLWEWHLCCPAHQERQFLPEGFRRLPLRILHPWKQALQVWKSLRFLR